MPAAEAVSSQQGTESRALTLPFLRPGTGLWQGSWRPSFSGHPGGARGCGGGCWLLGFSSDPGFLPLISIPPPSCIATEPSPKAGGDTRQERGGALATDLALCPRLLPSFL